MSYRDIQEERERLEADCTNCTYMCGNPCECKLDAEKDLEEDEMYCGFYEKR
jgi:hypothetical protein